MKDKDQRSMCKCIKETELPGITPGMAYPFTEYMNAKIIWTKDAEMSHNPPYCNEEYFFEHFAIIR